MQDRPASTSWAASRIERLLGDGRNESHDANSEDDLEIEEDQHLLQRARRAYKAYIFPMFVCMLHGLTSLMYVPSIRDVLIATHGSDNPIRAFQRYLSTVNHVIEWYNESGSRKLSLKRVRRLHKISNQIALRENKRAMTQFDMVVTQWAFIAPALIFGDRLGMKGASDEEKEALAYQMYVVGHALGVKDEYNLCNGSLKEIREYCWQIHSRVVVPGMLDASGPSERMSQHLVDGIGLLNPFVYRRPFLTWLFQIFEVSSWSDRLSSLQGWKEKFMWQVQQVVFNTLLVTPVVSWLLLALVLNPLIKLNIYLANKMRKKIIKDYEAKMKTE